MTTPTFVSVDPVTKRPPAAFEANYPTALGKGQPNGIPGLDNDGDVRNAAGQKIGAAGKSAYDIAVDHGFVGTEEAWLDSLALDNSWGTLTGRPSITGTIFCPNDIQLPRVDPRTGIAYAPIDNITWVKKSEPDPTVAREEDGWEPRDF